MDFNQAIAILTFMQNKLIGSREDHINLEAAIALIVGEHQELEKYRYASDMKQDLPDNPDALDEISTPV